MAAELLASKVVILEEEPSIPTIAALPSAVTLCLGITERGPIADPQLLAGFEEYNRIFGGFTLYSEVTVAVYGFFRQGGTFMWVSRTCHFTDNTDPRTATATTGSVELLNSGTLQTYPTVGPSDAGPWNLAQDGVEEKNLRLKYGPVVHPALRVLYISGSPARGDLVDEFGDRVYEPYNLVGGETYIAVIDYTGYPVLFDVSDFAVPGAATAAEVALRINASILGGKCLVGDDGSKYLYLVSDKAGLDSQVNAPIYGGTAVPIIGYMLTESTGGGEVGNIRSVTALEMEVLIEALGVDLGVTVASNQLTMRYNTPGAAYMVQVLGTSDYDFGFDNDEHIGEDAVAETTLTCYGKYPGTYSDDLKIAIEAATNGQAESFNLKVLDSGIVKETWPNLNMDETSANYVESLVNNENLGSRLIAVVDAGLTPLLNKRPVNVVSANMTGGGDGLAGIADSDYIGNVAGPTGLYTFDRINTGRILIVPGMSTEAIYKGMMDYAELDRNGSMFCFLDCAAGLNKTNIVSTLTGYGIFEYSEFAAIHWPRIKVANPAPEVYGDVDTITVPPSGWIAGKCAANDQKLGGVYEAPAGYGEGWGVIRGMMGVEDDPGGKSQHEVLDEKTRDYVYPYRINPFNKTTGGLWYIDGSRTLKSTGNFPSIGERRGVIFIAESLKEGLQIFRHRFNNRTNRQRAGRSIKQFLVGEMGKGAFRSTNPETAFFVDVSDNLNPVANEFAGIMTIRVGLATNKPTDWIILLITQDTRALEESLAA